jgi:hypothetical protein
MSKVLCGAGLYCRGTDEKIANLSAFILVSPTTLDIKYLLEAKSFVYVVSQGTSDTHVAMNATKRKFNALLGGIGNNSSSSLTSKEVNNASNVNSTAGSADSQNKKPRISSSISRSSLAPVLKGTPLHNKLSNMSHKKSASVATGVLSEETPKYAPWDRAAFLKRLKSFSDLTDWTPKPARVNEVQWAKRGWVCQKKERVRCCLCNVEIVVKLNRKEVDGKEEPVYVAQNIGRCCDNKFQKCATDLCQKTPW